MRFDMLIVPLAYRFSVWHVLSLSMESTINYQFEWETAFFIELRIFCLRPLAWCRCTMFICNQSEIQNSKKKIKILKICVFWSRVCLCLCLCVCVQVCLCVCVGVSSILFNLSNLFPKLQLVSLGRHHLHKEIHNKWFIHGHFYVALQYFKYCLMYHIQALKSVFCLFLCVTDISIFLRPIVWKLRSTAQNCKY